MSLFRCIAWLLDKELILTSPVFILVLILIKVDDRRFFCHQLGVLEVPDLGNYLGMPSCVGRNKRGSIH